VSIGEYFNMRVSILIAIASGFLPAGESIHGAGFCGKILGDIPLVGNTDGAPLVGDSLPSLGRILPVVDEQIETLIGLN
jgi:hypothetical protein